MITRRKALLIGGAAAVAVTTPGGLMAADNQHFGEYLGIWLGMAKSGATFEESLTRLTYSNAGMVLEQTFHTESAPYTFKVRYDNSWMFRLKNWGVDHCPAIRQHKSSTLAQVIFCPPDKPTVESPDFVAILGEGMPVPLATFYKSGRPIQLLRAMHDDQYRAARPAPHWSAVSWYDEAHALALLSSGRGRDAEQYLEDATNNVWTASEDEIDKRMRFVALAAANSNPALQIAALRTLTLSARVIQGVPVTLRALANHAALEASVRDQALDAALCLMFESHQRVSGVVRLERRFGVSTIADIHAMTKGEIDAEVVKDMEEFSRPTPPSRQWTREHLALLRAAVERVLAEANLGEHARKNAERGLRDYAL